MTCCAFLCSPLPVCMCEWESVCVLYRRMCTEESRFFMRSFKGGEHYVEIVHVDEWSGKKCLSLVCFSRKRALASLQSTNYYYYPSTKIVIWEKRIYPNEHFVEKGVIGPTVIRNIRGWWGHRTDAIVWCLKEILFLNDRKLINLRWTVFCCLDESICNLDGEMDWK